MGWRRYDMETLSALVAFCEGTLPIIGRVPSQRATDAQCFLCRLPEQAVGQIAGVWWFETPWRSCRVAVTEVGSFRDLSPRSYWLWPVCITCRRHRSELSVDETGDWSVNLDARPFMFHRYYVRPLENSTKHDSHRDNILYKTTYSRVWLKRYQFHPP